MAAQRQISCKMNKSVPPKDQSVPAPLHVPPTVVFTMPAEKCYVHGHLAQVSAGLEPFFPEKTARTPRSKMVDPATSTQWLKGRMSPPCPHLCSPEPTRLEKGHSRVEVLVILGIGMYKSQYTCIYICVCVHIYIYSTLNGQFGLKFGYVQT